MTTMQPTLRRLALLPCFLLLFSGAASPQAGVLAEAAGSVELVYAPENGSLFEVTETLRRETAVEGQPPVTDVRERVSRVLVACTDTGFSNLTRLVSQTLKSDGTPVGSPVHASMRDLDLTYQLDKQGRLHKVHGYERLPEAMRTRLPDQVASSISRLLNLDSLARQDRREYELTYDGLLGETFTVDQPRASAALHDLPYGGRAVVYSVATLSRSAPQSAVLSVSRRFNSDPVALVAAPQGVDESTLAAAKGALVPTLPANHGSASVRGSSETTVNRGGLLISSQRVQVEYALSVRNDSGQAVQYRIDEIRELTVESIDVPGDSQPPPS